MNHCRTEVDIFLRGKDVYQHLSGISNTSFAVLYLFSKANQSFEEVDRTVRSIKAFFPLNVLTCYM